MFINYYNLLYPLLPFVSSIYSNIHSNYLLYIQIHIYSFKFKHIVLSWWIIWLIIWQKTVKYCKKVRTKYCYKVYSIKSSYFCKHSWNLFKLGLQIETIIIVKICWVSRSFTGALQKRVSPFFTANFIYKAKVRPGERRLILQLLSQTNDCCCPFALRCVEKQRGLWVSLKNCCKKEVPAELVIVK